MSANRMLNNTKRLKGLCDNVKANVAAVQKQLDEVRVRVRARV